MTPRVAEGAAARKASILEQRPKAIAALSRLRDALNAVDMAAGEVERHRTTLRSGAISFKALPPLLLKGARKLVERAAAELEAAR
jgi:hypothetical protein